ncbi:uncharacterized protein LOC135202061 [Macrobrachium nipponense]|uniref:uncharacterized protein LOC135202061 n=1 Tax=Macrobrachium nipponense TaxID=159736 RepID=UPI0030C824CB
MVVAYLDDWLVWAPSIEECNKTTDKVICFLEHLGFKINRGKSCLTLESRFQWLGIQWDLDSHTLSIPPAKRKEIAKATRQFLKCKQMSRRNQERILGSLQFASVTDRLLKAKLKDINRVWRSRANARSRDRLAPIPEILRKRLRPWAEAKNIAKKIPLQFPPPALVIQEGARDLVPPVPTASYKRPGSYGSVPYPEETPSGQEITLKAGARQCRSCALHKQGRLKIKSSKSHDDSHLLNRSQEQLASIGHSPSRDSERGSRRAFTLSSSGVRVVSGQQVIQVVASHGTGARGGSVCNRVKSQASMLCGFQPGPSGFRHGRTGIRLEPMEEDISFPSSEPSLEGPAQIEIFQGPGGSHSPQLAEEQLVSSNDRIRSESSSAAEAHAVPTSPNEDCVRFLRSSQSPNFMDFMKFAAQRGADIDPQNILFLESDKRESTLRQYDSAVKKLAVFLNKSDVHTMTQI